MITTVQDGLADIHRGQTPLLDRVELQDRGRVRATRTYADGTQYLLLSDPGNPSTAGRPVAWSRFVTVTQAGVDQLRKVIRDSVLPYRATPIPDGPSGGGGRIVWIVNVDGQERVVETRSGTYDALPPFVRQLDEVVSQNVQRGE